MKRIKPEVMQSLRACAGPEELQAHLRAAVQLEFATIPPYLTAWFSTLQPYSDIGNGENPNAEAAAIVRSVVIEEMLHMTLAANTLIAVGGNPSINGPDFPPRYPGPLPMCVEEGLIASLKSLSAEQALNVFMAIEHPDTPAKLPGEAQCPAIREQIDTEGPTIGDFYDAIIEKIRELGDGLFADPRAEQQVDLSYWYPHEPPLTGVDGAPGSKVVDVHTAVQALELIVDQGEGGPDDDPIDPYGNVKGELAHYFRFGEIVFGRRLVKDPADPSGWSYTGGKVPVDESEIRKVLPNAALSDYPEGSEPYLPALEFHQTYRRLLNALHQTFNGAPDTLNRSIAVMYELRLAAEKVMRIPLTGDSLKETIYAAPPFQETRPK